MKIRWDEVATSSSPGDHLDAGAALGCACGGRGWKRGGLRGFAGWGHPAFSMRRGFGDRLLMSGVLDLDYAGGVEAGSPGCEATPGSGNPRNHQPRQGFQISESTHPSGVRIPIRRAFPRVRASHDPGLSAPTPPAYICGIGHQAIFVACRVPPRRVWELESGNWPLQLRTALPFPEVAGCLYCRRHAFSDHSDVEPRL